MAGEKIRLDDLIEQEALNIDDAYRPGVKGAIALNKKWVDSFVEIEEAIKKVIALQDSQSGKGSGKSGSGKSGSNSSKSTTNARVKNIAKLNALQKEQKRVLDTLNKTLAKKELAESKEVKTTLRLREEIKTLNAKNRQQAIIASKVTGAYAKLGAKLVIARRKAKDLGAQYGETSSQFKRAAKNVNALDAKLKSLDAAVGQNVRKVGGYKQAIRGTITNVKRLTAALGIMSGAFLAARIGRDTFRRIRDFGKQMYDIAGIMGTTRAEISDVEEDIKSVASQSIRTSNEVAELAETLVTLGKTKKEIKDLLEPVNNLSIALRATPEQAGQLLVTTLNAFKKTSESAQHFSDVIASARQNTALDFQRIRDALNYIGPSASALNIPLEKTTAILGVLVNNGIKASQAGRVLRTAMGRLAKSGITLDQAISKVANIKEEDLPIASLISSLNAEPGQGENLAKLGTAAELLGQRAAPLALILSRNSDEIERLNGLFVNAAGTLDKFIGEQLKSLDSQIKILESSWEKYILDINGASGASNVLKDVIGYLSNNLSEIIGFIGYATAAWLGYKTMVKLANIQTALLNVSTKSLGKALKANAIGLIVAGVTLAVYAFNKFNKTLKEVAQANNEAFINFKKTSETIKSQQENVLELSKKYDYLKLKSDGSTEAQSELQAIISKLADKVPFAAKEFDKYGKIIGINTDELRDFNKEELKRQNILGNLSIKGYEKQIKDTKKEIDELLKQGDKAFYSDKLNKGLFETAGAFNALLSKTGLVRRRYEDLDKSTKVYNETLNDLNKNLKDARRNLRDTNELTKEYEATMDRLENPLTEMDTQLGIHLTKWQRIYLSQQQINDLILKRKKYLKDQGLAPQIAETVKLSEILKKIAGYRSDIAKIRAKVAKDGSRKLDAKDIITKQGYLNKEIALYKTLTGIQLGSAKATKDQEDANKKYLDSLYDLRSYILKNYIKDQQEIADREDIALQERLDAAENVKDAELKLAKITFESKLEGLKQFNQEYIDSIKENGLLTAEQEAKINEKNDQGDFKYPKQLLKYKEYLRSRMDAFSDYQQGIVNIEKSSASYDQGIDISQFKTELNNALAEEAEHFKNRTDEYDKFKNKDKAARKLYAQKKLEIEQKSNMAILADKIKHFESLLEAEEARGGNEAEIESLKEKISELRRLMSEMGISIKEGDIEKVKATTSEILQGVGDVVGQIQALGDTLFQNRIQEIDEEQRKKDEYYQNILDNEHLTEAERERIQKNKEKSQIASEKKIAKVKRKQAEYDKAMALVQAAINTAVAITKAGGNIPLIVLAAASGALQIAAIASQKIPKYAEGTDYHKGGKALFGEERPEVILEPNKSPYVQKSPIIKDLPKGTQVVPSLGEYNKMISASMLSGVNSDNEKLRQYQASLGYGKYDKAMLEQMILTRKAFEKSKPSKGYKPQRNIDLNHEIFRNNNLRWE